jgi:hypothetical protein
MRDMWHLQLSRLNTGLASGPIAPGARVQLLTYSEVVEATNLVFHRR